MFGYLRFILAFLVLISHVDIKIFGLNPGVVAVVIFYLLAGHVVSHLWENVLPGGRAKLFRFYRDRFLRIMPLYLYVALLTLVFLAFTGYGGPDYSLFKLAGNLLVIPLNYYMVLDFTILTTPSWCLIPPAWSLGAELQAYLLLPLVFVTNRLRILLTAASFGVYLLANLGILNPDYFGYRLIFGVFFIFVAGSCIQKNRPEARQGLDRVFPWVLWGVVAGLGVIFFMFDLFSPTYTRETFLGLLAGIPLVYFLEKSRVKLPFNALLGSLSYGVFLAHFLVIWWLDCTGFIDSHSPFYVPVITLVSTFIAFSGVVWLEKPVDRIRKEKSIAFIF